MLLLKIMNMLVDDNIIIEVKRELHFLAKIGVLYINEITLTRPFMQAFRFPLNKTVGYAVIYKVKIKWSGKSYYVNQ